MRGYVWLQRARTTRTPMVKAPTIATSPGFSPPCLLWLIGAGGEQERRPTTRPPFCDAGCGAGALTRLVAGGSASLVGWRSVPSHPGHGVDVVGEHRPRLPDPCTLV